MQLMIEAMQPPRAPAGDVRADVLGPERWW